METLIVVILLAFVSLTEAFPYRQLLRNKMRNNSPLLDVVLSQETRSKGGYETDWVVVKNKVSLQEVIRMIESLQQTPGHTRHRKVNFMSELLGRRSENRVKRSIDPISSSGDLDGGFSTESSEQEIILEILLRNHQQQQGQQQFPDGFESAFSILHQSDGDDPTK